MFRASKWPVFLVALLLFSEACAYIVLPEGLESESLGDSTGWMAIPTSVVETDAGGVRIDLTLRNDTGDWSAMNATEGVPATLRTEGQSTECEQVFVGTGGHRLAPGFQMRGYIGGTKAEPILQQIFVECAEGAIGPDSTLSIDYSYVTGQYNYYEQDKNLVEGTLEVALSEVVGDLTYPVALPIEGLIQDPSIPMLAINKAELTLRDIQRTEDGLEFTWQTSNPGDYPTYVHIGNPPVIGADGILYGYYETPDIVSVPITPAGETAEWTTTVSVPAELQDSHILLSVETGKARLFANYVIDLTGL